MHIPKMSDTPGVTIPGLADNFNKLNFVADNAGFHNSIYRRKNLGTSVTSEQWANIANGSFKDMYVGDFWTINGTKYEIAAFNYYRNTGDTSLSSNHLTLVPSSVMYSHVMNSTNTTEGGYAGSEMYISGLDQAKTKIHTDFSGHVITHRRYLCNAVANGQASAGAWFDSDVELMNEVMFYGSVINGSATFGLYNIGIEKTQLPLFALRPEALNIGASQWLRDVASAADFATAYGNGRAYMYNAGSAASVRPVFSIS